MNSKKFFYILAIQVAVVVIATLVYLNVNPSSIYKFLSGDVIYAKSDIECDLHKSSCMETLSDGKKITFSISPKPITVMTPLELEIVAPDIKKDEITVEIFGENMNMGLYKYHLKPDENGTYRSKALIPSCVGEMNWRVNIILEYPTSRLGTYFKFNTK